MDLAGGFQLKYGSQSTEQLLTPKEELLLQALRFLYEIKPLLYLANIEVLARNVPRGGVHRNQVVHGQVLGCVSG